MSPYCVCHTMRSRLSSVSAASLTCSGSPGQRMCTSAAAGAAAAASRLAASSSAAGALPAIMLRCAAEVETGPSAGVQLGASRLWEGAVQGAGRASRALRSL